MNSNEQSSKWKQGPVVLVGNWEPLVFRRRVNLGPTNRAELYDDEHTQAYVQRLKDLGVNLYITHYFKGFGLQTEAWDIAKARELLRHCHEAGIHVGAYIGDTIILETMLNEEPQAGTWHQVMPDGSPIYYGGTQTFRFRWCLSNPAYMAYMTRVLTQAVSDGFDLIHLDNWVDKPEPMSCHCPWCQDAFRAFLTEHLTEEQRRERLGFVDVRHVLPPVFTTPLYIEWAKDTITNPLLQEWIRFRCHLRSTTYQRLSELCRSLRSDIAMECNPTGIWGENSAYLRGVNHDQILPHGDFFWDESPNPYGVLDNGAICTHIRGMKMGEQYNDRTFYYSGGDVMKIAEGLAFNNGCAGMLGCPPGCLGDLATEGKIASEDAIRPYVALLHDRPELFCRTRSLARVAVYRNPLAMATHSLTPQLQAILAEETLLEHHIPFDIRLNLDNLDYGAILVPGLECLSSAEIERLRNFAEQGGRLILIGSVADMDLWRRRWPTHPFGDIKMSTKPVNVGKGWIARLPELQLPAKAPAIGQRAIWDEHYPVVDARFWILPRNARSLLDALAIRKPGGLSPMIVKAARTTMVEMRASKDDSAVMIHMLRFGDTNRKETVTVRMPAPRAFDSLKLVVPGGPGAKDKAIPCRREKGTLTFDVVLGVPYAVAVLVKATKE
ncbi:MAG: hypothetical protein IT440_14725 [Phycisphaeraceae bacterium]|nr:hypothetical protein [Phycisphaeraceae bacterium]